MKVLRGFSVCPRVVCPECSSFLLKESAFMLSGVPASLCLPQITPTSSLLSQLLAHTCTNMCVFHSAHSVSSARMSARFATRTMPFSRCYSRPLCASVAVQITVLVLSSIFAAVGVGGVGGEQRPQPPESNALALARWPAALHGSAESAARAKSALAPPLAHGGVGGHCTMRCRGGEPEQGESAWVRRLEQWEGEDQSTADGGVGDSPAPAQQVAGASTGGGEQARVGGGGQAGGGGGGAARASGVPVSATAEDRVLERARRASVIQELLSMGADIRRAGEREDGDVVVVVWSGMDQGLDLYMHCMRDTIHVTP